MHFHVDPHAPLPMYAQIVDQVRSQIVMGQLLSGQTLPSVRAMAEQLEINSLTVQKAYKQLEVDGLIQIRKGVGATVSDAAISKLKQGSSWNPAEELKPIVNKARMLGVGREDFHGMVDRYWED